VARRATQVKQGIAAQGKSKGKSKKGKAKTMPCKTEQINGNGF